MKLNITNTKNGTLIVNYQTENPRQEILNRIWNEREEYLNKLDKEAMKIMFFSRNMGSSLLEEYDKKTHHIQHKTDYHSQWKLNQLINELKGLTPLYSDYTIISVDYEGAYYGMDYSPEVHVHMSTDEDCWDCVDLITKPFTELIKVLEGYLKSHVFSVYSFNLELLPNSKKSKRKRTHIPRGVRHEVFKRDNYTCVECGAKKEDGATLHIDHIIPVAKGGTDEMSNLQTLCADCNLNKSDIIQNNNILRS